MPEEREEMILDLLEQRGSCSYEQLSRILGVSTMTVRRSIDELARRGAAIKTVGGARRSGAPEYLYESDLRTRLLENRPEKQAIARLAMELIRPPVTIYLDGSTTCLELAKLLARRSVGEITIVTNSALACLELGRGRGNRVIGIAGQYDPASLCFAGPRAEDFAAQFFVDLAITSTKGFVPAAGTFESAEPIFRIKQTIARQCGRLVLLADHTKIGRRALSKVLDASRIDTVITDSGVGRAQLAAMRKSVRQVLVALVPGPEATE